MEDLCSLNIDLTLNLTAESNLPASVSILGNLGESLVPILKKHRPCDLLNKKVSSYTILDKLKIVNFKRKNRDREKST